MTKPIRVLHVLQRFEAAGVQKFLINVYNHIDKEKIQFDFIVHYKTPQFFDKEIEKNGGKIYRFSVREDYNLFKYIKELNRFFKEHKEYQIIHGHMPVLGFIYFKIAKKYNVKVRIAHSHTMGFVKSKNILKKIIKLITNKLYKKYATHLFASSINAGKYMFKDEKFVVIPNAIDTNKFIYSLSNKNFIRKEFNIENQFVIGCIGRFEPVKNHKFAINVFESLLEIHPNSKLIFVGSGDLETELKMLIHEKKLEENVLFLGNRNDVEKIYHALDVLLFPSLYEGLGMVGIEAQAAGIPVVCSKNLPEELNITPLIYRVSLDEDIEQWVKVLLSTQNNSYKYKDMSKYVIDANFDINKLVEQLQDFYIQSYKNSK